VVTVGPGPNSGTALRFQGSDGTEFFGILAWEVSQLSSRLAVAGNDFGSSVVISGETAVVGANNVLRSSFSFSDFRRRKNWEELPLETWSRILKHKERETRHQKNNILWDLIGP